MKIVFILPGKGRAGGVRCTVISANMLLERGHDVRILYRRFPTTIRSLTRELRNKICYKRSHDWLETFKGRTSSYHDIGQCIFYPDEIIISVGMWCSAQISKLNNIKNKKLQYIHGPTPWTPEVMDQALSSSIPKIAVSSKTAEIINSYNSSDLLAVIHNGINLDEYYPSVNEQQRDGIGTIYETHPTYAKDPETLLKVLIQLKKELPNVPHYTFGGAPRPKEISKKEYKRYPSLEEARRRYSSSKVWILGSRSEGFPGPVLEAMACGCAVVATDCGGTKDMIVDGENGYLVEPGNVDEIVNKVKILLDNPTLREKMVTNAFKTVCKLNWDNSANKLEDVLKKIAAN